MSSFMRSDVLKDNKNLTIKMSKELNLAFRAICFRANLSPSQVIVEFIEQLTKETKSSNSILKSASVKKFKRDLEGIKSADKKRKNTRAKVFGEIDSDSLYAILENLREIEENEFNKND